MIYVANVDGSGQTRLTDNSSGLELDPRWSPDGRRIAFITDSGLYVANADGTSEPFRFTDLRSVVGALGWVHSPAP